MSTRYGWRERESACTGPTHGRQRPGTGRARGAQSPSPSCHRRTVSSQRVLRSPRPCPSQVRDAPPGAGRRTDDHGGSYGLRFLTPRFQPGSSDLRRGGIAWAGPQKAGAAACPQALGSRHGVRRPRADKGSNTSRTRVSVHDPETVRIVGSPTQHRTCAGAAHKKGR